MTREDDIFGALANPARRKLLALLAQGPLNAGQLAAQFALSRPAISEHMRILVNAGFASERQSGRERIYTLNQTPFQAMGAWLTPFETYWSNRLAILAKQIEENEDDN